MSQSRHRSAQSGGWREWYHADEVWATYFGIGAVFFLGMRQSFLLRGTTGLTPMQTAVCVAALVLLLAWLLGGVRPAHRIPLWPTAISMILLVGNMLSYAAQAIRGMPVSDTSGEDHALRAQIIATVVFFVVLATIRTLRAIRILLGGLVIGGTLSAGYAVFRTVTGVDVASHIRIPVILKDDTSLIVQNLMRAGAVRPQGAAGHPLELGAVLSVLVPIAVGLTLDSRSRGGRWWWWAGSAGLLVAGALSTVSRSSVFGLLAGFVMLALYWPIRRTLLTIGGAAIVLIGASLLHVKLVTDLWRVLTSGSNDGSLTSRTFGAEYVAKHFLDHLWFGQGIGSYDLSTQPVLDDDYLSRLMEGGVVVMVAFAAFLVMGLVCSQVAARRGVTSGNRPLTQLASGVGGAILATIGIAFILDIGGFPQISMLIVLLCAIAVCMSALEEQPTQRGVLLSAQGRLVAPHG